MATLTVWSDGLGSIAEWDFAADTITVYRRDERPDLADGNECGWLAQIEGHQVILYRAQQALWLQVDHKRHRLDEHVRVETQQDVNSAERFLRVVDGERVVVDLRYTLDRDVFVVCALGFCMQELSHFDFGLHVVEVLEQARHVARQGRTPSGLADADAT